MITFLGHDMKSKKALFYDHRLLYWGSPANFKIAEINHPT